MKRQKRFVAIAGLALAAGIGLTAFTGGPDKKYTSFDLNCMDTGVKPGADFFTYANGGLIKKNPIPSTQSRWGSFSELAEKNRALLHTILEEASADKNAPKGSTRQL